jgi:hypothetical protein
MKNYTDTEDYRISQLLDRFIRELFLTGITYVYDPKYRRDTNDSFHKANKKLYEMFTDRLEREHPKSGYVSNGGIYEGIDCFKVEVHGL